MKLISAHIENFGKFQKKDFDFDAGLNSFLHENGWGKTTLSVFIKSMLYGLEKSSKKNLDENEWQKYFPWQGGIYGGNLVFEHNGKKYRISRTFGKTKSDTTFELLDLQTNKISHDFSEKLGEEIYGIGRETYARSVHVTLDETPAGSPEISAKLSNLIEADDVGNFDKAYSALDGKATELKAKRGGGGLISSIQNKIDSDRETLSDIQARILQNEKYSTLIEETNEKTLALKKNQNSLTEKIAISAKYEGKIRYEQLKSDAEKAEKSKSEIEKFFNGHIPDSATLGTIDSVAKDFSTLESNIKNLSMTQAEKDNYASLKESFGGDIPTDAEIKSCISSYNKYNDFKQNEGGKKLTEEESEDFGKLQKIFSGKDVSEEKINGYMKSVSDVQSSAAEIAGLENEKQKIENDLKFKKLEKGKNTKQIIFFGLTAAFLILGLIAFVLTKNILFTLAGIGCGIVSAVLAIVSKPKKQDFSEQENEILRLENEIKNKKDENSKKESEYKNFIFSIFPASTPDTATLSKINIEYNRYDALKNKQSAYNSWLSSQTEKPETLESEIKSFLKRYCKTDEISTCSTEINALNGKLSRLHELENKTNADSENEKKFSEAKEKLSQILSQYETEKTQSYQSQVQQIHTKLADLKNAENAITEAKKKIRDFEDDPKNDVESFSTLAKPEKSVDELNEELSSVTRKLNDLNREISDYQKRFDDNLSVTEKKEDIESEIENFSVQKKEKETEHDLLIKARDLLSKAKENLDANYSDPMKEGFKKYVHLLCDGGQIGDTFQSGLFDNSDNNLSNGEKIPLTIDTDLKVSVNGATKNYESDYLSAGYKDMVNFCSRMALIDALFTEEKPTVILDDPFVNLDDDKVPAALNLVKKMAGEKQILYFACHKSREVK